MAAQLTVRDQGGSTGATVVAVKCCLLTEFPRIMADKIRLKVVTPGRLVLDEEVDEVTAPGVKGEFGVLPNHIAFLTTFWNPVR